MISSRTLAARLSWAVVATVAASPAAALPLELTFLAGWAFTPDATSADIEVPAFDPRQGTLVSAELEWTATVDVFAGLGFAGAPGEATPEILVAPEIIASFNFPDEDPFGETEVTQSTASGPFVLQCAVEPNNGSCFDLERRTDTGGGAFRTGETYQNTATSDGELVLRPTDFVAEGVEFGRLSLTVFVPPPIPNEFEDDIVTDVSFLSATMRVTYFFDPIPFVPEAPDTDTGGEIGPGAAEIPLPVPGVLLVSGLAGLALARARRARA